MTKAQLFRLEQHAEPWQKDHQEVMANYKNANRLSSAIAVFNDVFDSVCKTNGPITTTHSKLVANLWMRWFDGATALYQASEVMSTSGFEVHGIDRLNRNLQTVSGFVSFLPRHISACEEMLKGEGKVIN